jgi:hypothetical protein
MAKTSRERQEDAREKRLEHMREQILSGDLVVRQMTASERKRWEDRSAASDRHATRQERARRDAVRKKRRAKNTGNA